MAVAPGAGMITLKRLLPLLIALSAACGSTCQQQPHGDAGPTATSNAGPRISLAGVDTASLSAREHVEWSGYVSELLAPCPDVAVPIAQCVSEKRDCAACLPAAKFLLRQVQAGAPKEQVSELFAMRFDPKMVKTIVLGDSPAKGSDNPSLTIVEFADFECSACAMAHPLIEALYQKYAKKMRVVYKHFPLSVHPNAKLAAHAAYAAQKQGAFWKMHKTLFENQDRLTEPDLVGFATEIGLDVDRFKKDLHSDETKERVEREMKQGESLGVDATPTIFINGRECDLTLLANPLKDLEDWMDLEIMLAGGNSSAPSALPTVSAGVLAAPSASAAP